MRGIVVACDAGSDHQVAAVLAPPASRHDTRLQYFCAPLAGSLSASWIEEFALRRRDTPDSTPGLIEQCVGRTVAAMSRRHRDFQMNQFPEAAHVCRYNGRVDSDRPSGGARLMRAWTWF